MTNIQKLLTTSIDFEVCEYVLKNNKSIHLSFSDETVCFYMVSGCVALYQLDQSLNIIDNDTLASGQFLKLNMNLIKSVLVESIGSFDEDAKFLKITKN